MMATSFGRIQTLQREGAVPMTSAPVRDPVADAAQLREALRDAGAGCICRAVRNAVTSDAVTTLRGDPRPRASARPGIRLYGGTNPGEDWYWCYLDRLVFELESAPAAPSHL